MEYKFARIFNHPHKSPLGWRIPGVGMVGVVTVSTAALAFFIGFMVATRVTVVAGFVTFLVLMVVPLFIGYINLRYNKDLDVNETTAIAYLFTAARNRHVQVTIPDFKTK